MKFKENKIKINKSNPDEKNIPVAEKSNYYIGLLYLVLITLAEILTAYTTPQWGITLHSIILGLLLIHYSFIPLRSIAIQLKPLLLALCLAPLIRIISLSMPLKDFEFVYWFIIIGIPLFIASFIVIRVLGLKLKDINLNWENPVATLLIALSGIMFGFIEYYILKPEPIISSLNLKEIIIPGLIFLIFTGFLEELIFRGIIQNTIEKAFQNFTLVYVATLFAALHIGNRSLTHTIFVFIVGLFFSWVVKKTGSLLGVTLSHGLINIFLYLIFPFISK
ncbi:MAG: CPBP family intramembrane glutamic endopeptidase [Actinomycetota bacterium]